MHLSGYGALWSDMAQCIGKLRVGGLPKSDADELFNRKLGKLWNKDRVRLFLDYLVDAGPQGQGALLSRECDKTSSGMYENAYTRYRLTNAGRSVLRQYRARLSADAMGSSSVDGTGSSELIPPMPPPLFVLEWEEVHGADVCRNDGDEGDDEVHTHAAPSNLRGPCCMTPLLRGSRAACHLLHLLMLRARSLLVLLTVRTGCGQRSCVRPRSRAGREACQGQKAVLGAMEGLQQEGRYLGERARLAGWRLAMQLG